MVVRKQSKRLVYRNKYGMYLIMGTLDKGKPEEMSFFKRGGDVICFKLVEETERVCWYVEFDPTIIEPEPAVIPPDPVAE